MSTILVTGGTGMVGKHLQKILPNAHYVGTNDGDLNDETELIYILAKYFHTPKEGDRIIHLAAKVGGIQDNMNNPASFYDQNIMMNFSCKMIKFEHKQITLVECKAVFLMEKIFILE